MHYNYLGLLHQRSNKEKTKKSLLRMFPNAAIFFEIKDLFIPVIRAQNIQEIIGESTKKSIKNSLILAISTNEIT
jgi:hypothetical protein